MLYIPNYLVCGWSICLFRYICNPKECLLSLLSIFVYMHETTGEPLDRLSCNTALKKFIKRCNAILVFIYTGQFNDHYIWRPMCVCVSSALLTKCISQKKVIDKMKHFMFSTFFKSAVFTINQIPITYLWLSMYFC